MVYLHPRADSNSCRTDLNSTIHHTDIKACQTSASRPYCWPPTGSRICIPSNIDIYWPEEYYLENSSFLINIASYNGTRKYSNAGKTYRPLYIDWMEWSRGRIDPDNANLSTVNLTLIELREEADGNTTRIAYPGPTLILDQGLDFSSYSSSHSSKKPFEWTDGRIVGVVFGCAIGFVLFVAFVAWCCGGCSGGKSETERIRRLEMRRQARERVEGRVDVYAVKEDVTVGNGPVATSARVDGSPVRPGGMWAVDMPRRPERTTSRASDEIRAIGVVEEQQVRERRLAEQRAEAQRVEAQMAEERRLEELEQLRVEETREEVARAEELAPPAYATQLPPPRYSP